MEASVRLRKPLLAADGKTAASPWVADALLRVSALDRRPKSEESSVIKRHLCRGLRGNARRRTPYAVEVIRVSTPSTRPRALKVKFKA
jgi:hypothetical protein